MASVSSQFVGQIPEAYDLGLGPVLFHDCADDLARRAAALAPSDVLELAAGTGIASRRLRDALPPDATLVASDLNPPMLEVARRKFRPDERVAFREADAMALPFPAASFDLVVCQFGVMFFPDKPASFREVGPRPAAGRPLSLQHLGALLRQPLPRDHHRDPDAAVSRRHAGLLPRPLLLRRPGHRPGRPRRRRLGRDHGRRHPPPQGGRRSGGLRPGRGLRQPAPDRARPARQPTRTRSWRRSSPPTRSASAPPPWSSRSRRCCSPRARHSPLVLSSGVLTARVVHGMCMRCA